MKYDPYSGLQNSFERTDPTGRWSPIEPLPEPKYLAWIGGAFFGAVLAAMLVLAL